MALCGDTFHANVTLRGAGCRGSGGRVEFFRPEGKFFQEMGWKERSSVGSAGRGTAEPELRNRGGVVECGCCDRRVWREGCGRLPAGMTNPGGVGGAERAVCSWVGGGAVRVGDRCVSARRYWRVKGAGRGRVGRIGRMSASVGRPDSGVGERHRFASSSGSESCWRTDSSWIACSTLRMNSGAIPSAAASAVRRASSSS